MITKGQKQPFQKASTEKSIALNEPKKNVAEIRRDKPIDALEAYGFKVKKKEPEDVIKPKPEREKFPKFAVRDEERTMRRESLKEDKIYKRERMLSELKEVYNG